MGKKKRGGMSKSKKKHDAKRARKNSIAKVEERMLNTIPAGYHRCLRCLGSGYELISKKFSVCSFGNAYESVTCPACNGSRIVANSKPNTGHFNDSLQWIEDEKTENKEP